MHSYFQSVTSAMAENSVNPMLRKYGDYKPKEISNDIPKGMIYLGNSSRDFDGERVFLSFKKRVTTLICGKPGSGKTNLVSLMTNQIATQHHQPVIIADPKWEFHTQAIPLKEKRFVEVLKKEGLKPQGLNLRVVTPEVCVDDGEDHKAGEQFILDLKDFKRVSQKNLLSNLRDFFKFDPGSAGEKTIEAFLDKMPDRFNDFLKKISQRTIAVKVDGQLMTINLSPSLRGSFYAKLQGRIIGDGHHIDFPKALLYNGDPNEPRVVILQLDADPEDYITSTYLKIPLMSAILDRTRAKRNAYGSTLVRPFTVVIDEADIYCPKDERSPSKKLIEQIVTKYRDRDISLIAATQRPQLISQTLVNNVDYVITARISTEEEAQMLRNRGISREAIDELRKLEWSEDNPAKEFGLVTAGGDVTTFFAPKAPAEQFKEDTSAFDDY